MNTIGIIGAMQVEIDAILEKLTQVQTQEHAGQTYHQGSLNGTNVVVTCSGIGKVNAAVATQNLITHYRPACVINTGIAGNLSADLKIGDVVISTTVAYHDFDPNLMKRYYPYLEQFTADEGLVAAAQQAVAQSAGANTVCKTGLIITGDIFLEDSALKQQLIQRYGALCVEMESAAIAHTCAKNNLPFVIVRSISDNADDDAQGTYDNFEQQVAHFTANIVANMVSQL